MDTTDTRMPTPATDRACDAVQPRAALTVSAPHVCTALDPAVRAHAAPDAAAQGTGLPFASRIRRTHAALDAAWSFGDVRPSELSGPVPRGAPV